MRGWILDLYTESPGKMVVWLRLEGGGTRRLVDRWSPSVFVASDDRAELAAVEKGWREGGRGFSWSRRVVRRERAGDAEESEVLELVVEDARRLAPLAEEVERSRPFGALRLYNVDIPPEQTYLYENDLFPLAYCEVSETRDGLCWDLLDDNGACVYDLPSLRSMDLSVRIKKAGRIARTTDPIEAIVARVGEEGPIVLEEADSEAEKILGLVELVERADPDLIFTSGGDAFVLPYLIERARASGVQRELKIDREGNAMEAPTKKGTPYFSYGKTLFKPSEVKLQGRIHLDGSSSFVCRETGMDGFFEVSRVCRLPLHTASRASIGKALSSLQFYHATKDGVLIPWKPVVAEHFKSRAELLVADRGGFVFEPELGVHEGIGELDFSSLFPSIMSKKNISPETVRCACCPDSANRVPELDWNVCERRPEGIVPKAVKVLVEKRMKYKRLMRATGGEERARYGARRDALKWVAVACLPRESTVLVRSDGADRLVKIGDFVDGLVGERAGAVECPPRVYVAGVGGDRRAKYCRVSHLIKKPNAERLLSFVAEDGRPIVTTTPDHPFFVLRGGGGGGGELEVRRAEELRAGEVVPVAKGASPSLGGLGWVDLPAVMADGGAGGPTDDLGFVRIGEIVQTDSKPDYVYCLRLEAGEVPGFFTGEGLAYTHNCFGYLGHSNAKFGRIDAHIAVCAWDRRVLMQAARVAEGTGFRVMHGIVDSLWLKKEGAGADDYERLRSAIEAETRFAISFEGIYKWIAFLPSKVSAGVPVLNRYFGAYSDGRLKVRGVEARRHDTPAFFSKCQLEILGVLAGAATAAEARVKVDECVGIFLGHANALLRHEVPIEGLVFTRNLSRAPGEYANRSLASIVAGRLAREGVELHAGERVRYVITDHNSKSPERRAVPMELVDGRTVYDARRYAELLAETCASVLRPFSEDCRPEGLIRSLESATHGDLV